jgi:hypothetical protein
LLLKRALSALLHVRLDFLDLIEDDRLLVVFFLRPQRDFATPGFQRKNVRGIVVPVGVAHQQKPIPEWHCMGA